MGTHSCRMKVTEDVWRVRGEGCWGKGPGRELLRWGGRGKQNLFIKVINDNLFFFKIVA